MYSFNLANFNQMDGKVHTTQSTPNMVQLQTEKDFDELQLMQRVMEPMRHSMDEGGAYIAMVGNNVVLEDEA